MRRLLLYWLLSTTGVLLGALPAEAAIITPSGTSYTINNTAGVDNTYPQIDGDLVIYSSLAAPPSTVRTHDLSTAQDTTIPNSGTTYDFESDVNAGRVVFTRVSPTASDIALYDTTMSPLTVTILDDPTGTANRRFPGIGGNNVVWQDCVPSGGCSIVVYNLVSGTATPLTDSTALNESPKISPDGTVVTWDTRSAGNLGSPAIYDAVYSGGSWVTHLITANGSCFWPDTNGVIVVYSCDRGSGDFVYFQPVGGGTEQAINWGGNGSTPSIAGNFIAFAGRPPAAAAHQLYVAELTHGTAPTWDGNLYQLTNGAADVQLNDITQEADGSVTGVWQQQEANEAVYGFNFMPESPQQQISGLAGTIVGYGLPHGLTTSLLAKLNAAQADFQAGSIALVCSDLQDLINEANAQSGKGLTSGPTGEAAQIINAATTIRQSLGC
jgi:hypothetical protein